MVIPLFVENDQVNFRAASILLQDDDGMDMFAMSVLRSQTPPRLSAELSEDFIT